MNCSFRSLPPCQVQYCQGLPVCLSVIEPVFSACKAPGSLSPVVESSETGGGKLGDRVCCSSMYSSSELTRRLSPAFNPLRVFPTTAQRLWQLPFCCFPPSSSPTFGTLAGKAPFFKHLLTFPCFSYLLFTPKKLKQNPSVVSDLLPSRVIRVSSDVLEKSWGVLGYHCREIFMFYSCVTTYLFVCKRLPLNMYVLCAAAVSCERRSDENKCPFIRVLFLTTI